MARVAKTPLYDGFNKSPFGYGRHAQEPASWRAKLDPEIPINLELGCGKAETSLFLAQKYPEQNFIGVDLKADRLWRACIVAEEQKLDNVAFIQENILNLETFIRPRTVSMIWITHPDPFPRDRQAKHRMLNRNFLDIYKHILMPGGVVRFKSDNAGLYEWALEYLKEQNDVVIDSYNENLHENTNDEDLLVESVYSKKHQALGATIHFIEFRFS